jgi:hypothetical protein
MLSVAGVTVLACASEPPHQHGCYKPSALVSVNYLAGHSWVCGTQPEVADTCMYTAVALQEPSSAFVGCVVAKHSLCELEGVGRYISIKTGCWLYSGMKNGTLSPWWKRTLVFTYRTAYWCGRLAWVGRLVLLL